MVFSFRAETTRKIVPATSCALAMHRHENGLLLARMACNTCLYTCLHTCLHTCVKAFPMACTSTAQISCFQRHSIGSGI